MKKFVTLFMVIAILVSACITPAYADGEIPLGDISTEPMQPLDQPRQPLKEYYTRAELDSIFAGTHNFDIPEGGLKFNAENFPLDPAEAATMSDEYLYIPDGDYLIALREDGDCLLYQNNKLTKSSYSNSNSFRWYFENIGDSIDPIYAIKSYDNPSLALRAVPGNNDAAGVSLGNYDVSDTTFHWSISASNWGKILYSEAIGTSAYWLSMSYDDDRMVLGDSASFLELIDASSYVHCTDLSFRRITCFVGTELWPTPTTTPLGANYLSNPWVRYTSSDTAVCLVQGEFNFHLLAYGEGHATITVEHLLYNITTTVEVYVNIEHTVTPN